jgi:hypothetical protein
MVQVTNLTVMEFQGLIGTDTNQNVITIMFLLYIRMLGGRHQYHGPLDARQHVIFRL